MRLTPFFKPATSNQITNINITDTIVETEFVDVIGHF